MTDPLALFDEQDARRDRDERAALEAENRALREAVKRAETLVTYLEIITFEPDTVGGMWELEVAAAIAVFKQSARDAIADPTPSPDQQPLPL